MGCYPMLLYGHNKTIFTLKTGKKKIAAWKMGFVCVCACVCVFWADNRLKLPVTNMSNTPSVNFEILQKFKNELSFRFYHVESFYQKLRKGEYYKCKIMFHLWTFMKGKNIPTYLETVTLVRFIAFKTVLIIVSI